MNVAEAQRVRDSALADVTAADSAYNASRRDEHWQAKKKALEDLDRAEVDLKLAKHDEGAEVERAAADVKRGAHEALKDKEAFINGGMDRVLPKVDAIVACVLSLHAAVKEVHAEVETTNDAKRSAKNYARIADVYESFKPPPSLDFIAMLVRVRLEQQGVDVAAWCDSSRVFAGDPLFADYETARRFWKVISPEIDPGTGAEIQRVEVLA